MRSHFKTTLSKTLTGVCLLVVFAACNQSSVTPDANAQSKVDLDNEQDKLGYTIGVQIATGMKSQNLQEDISLGGLMAGFEDVFAGQEVRLTEEQMQQVQIAYQQKSTGQGRRYC